MDSLLKDIGLSMLVISIWRLVDGE